MATYLTVHILGKDQKSPKLSVLANLDVLHKQEVRAKAEL